MASVATYIDIVNTFCSLPLRERRRQMPQIEATIAELMDATFEAGQDEKAVLASLELRLRMLRKKVLLVDSN